MIWTIGFRFVRVLGDYHATFVETVPFKTIATFTLFQTVYLLFCFGLTWIPIAGVLFPLLIMLLVPVRQYFLPKFFKAVHLQDLDAAEYEEAPAIAFNMSFEVRTILDNKNGCIVFYFILFFSFYADWFFFFFWQNQDLQARATNIDGAEVLDEVITRSRGEIRRNQSPKITSSTPSIEDIKPVYSPRLSHRVHSPRLNELRGEGSPRSTGKELELKQTPSPRPSILGKSIPGSSSSSSHIPWVWFWWVRLSTVLERLYITHS